MLATRYPVVLAAAALLGGLPATATAQDGGKGFSREGATTYRARPNPINKFHAIDRELGSLSQGNDGFWTQYLNKVQVDVDPDKFSDTKVGIPSLLGFRICDGVMAIKARNAEKLNQCADDIEKLARKMGVKDEEMTGARKVRVYANRGEWNRVVLELGYLQQDIERAQAGGADAKKILYAAGWLQGARYTSTIIHEHYNEEVAAFLREPLLAKDLADNLRSVKPEIAAHQTVKALLAAMDEIAGLIDVPLHATVPKDKVEQMFTTATDTVKRCVQGAN